MYDVKFMFCALVCWTISTGPTSAGVCELNGLLQKTFWVDLVRRHPNALICGTDQQTVSVRELFERFPNRAVIVDDSNYFDKLRQYYNLMTIIFSNALVWHLRYIVIIKFFHSRTNAEWDLDRFTLVMVVNSPHLYSQMKSAMEIFPKWIRYEWRKRQYDGVAPLLDDQLCKDLELLESVRNNPGINVLRKVEEIIVRWENFLNYNVDIVNWRNGHSTMPNMHAITESVIQAVALDFRGVIEVAYEFLSETIDQFLVDFEQIGFRYCPFQGFLGLLIDR